MKLSLFYLILILLMPGLGISQAISGEDTLPLIISDTAPLLNDQVDENLQKELLARLIKSPKWKKLISQKRMAVGLVDLSDPENLKFARINGNHMMYAASLPKIAILLAGMDAIDKGELEESAEIIQNLDVMIARSSNRAASFMIDKLGYEKIAEVLKSPRYMLFDENNGGGLWVGKRYAAAGPRYPDPIKGLSHAATVNQVCRFYYLLAMGKLVSSDRSKQMLNLMDEPKIHHKFVYTLQKVAPKAKLYRKSGSWKNYHADSIMVWGSDWRRYILVAMVEDSEGETIMRELIDPVESTLQYCSD